MSGANGLIAARPPSVRPHNIDIMSASDEALAARMDHAVALGSVVRLELSRQDNGNIIEVLDGASTDAKIA